MEELNFPRGGADRSHQLQSSTEQKNESSPTARSTKKKSRKRSESNDFLFGTTQDYHADKRTSKKSKKSKKITADSNTSAVNTTVSSLPLGGGAVQQPSDDKKKPAFIEAVSFQKLAKGMKLLGIVREVAPEYAVVSLPSMLTGFVRCDSNSGIRLDHVVSVGMVLPVVVLKATSETVNEKNGGRSSQPVLKRRIELTVSPLAVNNGLTSEMLYEGMSVRGRIRSVEDHGCLVDLNISGIGGSKCFLQYENVEGGYKILDVEDDDVEMDGDDDKFVLNKGRVYDFTISSLPKADSSTLKIYQLKLEKSHSRASYLTDPTICRNAKHTIRSLSPGMLLNVDVEHFARNGLCVTFMGNVYRGAIDSNNLGGYLPADFEGLKDKARVNDMWWKNVFSGKLRKLDARLIAIDPISKIMRFSLLPHIIELKAPQQESGIVGKSIENARVVRLDPGVGALLALPDDEPFEGSEVRNEILRAHPTYFAASKIKCAYVHISKAIDNEKKRTSEAQFAKKFSLNSRISKLRILSDNNWMDDVYSCATADSIVNSAVLSHLDLKPGVIYRSVPVIANLENGGVLVQLGVGVKGLIPEMHLFDKSTTTDSGNTSYRNKIKMEKYKAGNKIDVRCLMISPSEKKCILTAKKALISSDTNDPITDYASVENGRSATGFISRVSKQGIAITFYNNVFGRISSRKLADELGVEDPTVDYSTGDVVKVKIRRCFKRSAISNNDDEEDNEDSYILDLSLNLLSDINTSTSLMEDNSSAMMKLMIPGKILKAKSMKIVELVPSKERNANLFLPGHAIVSIKAKHLFDNKENDKSTVTCKLPYEHIMDSHDSSMIESPASMDALASKVFTVGKKIAQEAVVLTNTNRDGSISTPIISLKPSLVETIKNKTSSGKNEVLLPTQSTALFMGALVRGYCVRLHQKYGAFIRFLGGLTAIVPKLKGGLDIRLYDTVLCKIVAMDVVSGKSPKILLKQIHSISQVANKTEKKKKSNADVILPGHMVGKVRVDDINFARVAVTILDEKFTDARLKARIHVTMIKSTEGTTVNMPIQDKESHGDDEEMSGQNKEKITKYHPFFSLKVGNIIENLKCVAIDVKDGITNVDLSNRDDDKKDEVPPLLVTEPSHLKVGCIVQGIITSIAKYNKGLWIQICPGVNGFIPGLEVTNNIKVLNNLRKYFKVGGQLTCRVIKDKNDKGQFNHGVRLSLLALDQKIEGEQNRFKKPTRGDLVVGRVNRFMKEHRAPALMVELQGGFLGRCDITELEEVDEWENMPLGRFEGDGVQDTLDEVDEDEDDTVDARKRHLVGEYHHGLYVQCRVLSSSGSSKVMVEVSMRQSRIEGDLDNDVPPEEKEIVHAYVVSTTKKGCFLRLSRFVEGRVILKELSDSFLPDPTSMFPPGRLVVGKVKEVKNAKKGSKKEKKKFSVDLDMRESVLLEDQNKLRFEDMKEGEKHRGVVTRIESYGVFVRLENSEVSGLVHLSECSDDYIKNLAAMFNPGDLVKVLVLRVEKEERRIGLSMKPSHFEDDDSEDDSDIDSSMDSDDEDDDGDDNIVMKDITGLDSDDEDFVSKLAKKMDKNEEETNQMKSSDEDDGDEDGSDNEDSSDGDESVDEDSDENNESQPKAMDTDVGFDWGTNASTENQEDDGNSDSSDDSDDEESEDDLQKGKKNKKKSTAKRQEEKAISKMEQRIADGTADENPETTADFERLIASNPNSSEQWIKYMAYHLSLADIESARSVANRAFDRIEFREEGEKLNVWTALITLENKYGTMNSLNATIDRASQHNNPKQVYLRVCEMMEKDVEASHGDAALVEKADAMFAKMCKKFKSKKTVWIANFKYLLKNGRNDEAHKLWKRSVMSLPAHKHIESMSKFAQLEYEFGSAERARTIFDALLDKHQKRMDLIFVYVDKEVKHGELSAARRIFERISNPPNNGQKKAKFNDKQMKSLFKKWYRMEEDHGDDESMMRVKVAAKEYVERSSK